jgi:hypothetical protein
VKLLARPRQTANRPARKLGSPILGATPARYNDCSTEMSGEHLVSEVMLNLLTGPDGKVVRTGYPWQEEGEVQSLTPSTCKANVLCKRHNNALSSVDATAGRFLKAILRAPDFLQSHEIRVLMLSGDDVERWILKTLCTHIVAVRKFGDNWEPPSHGSTSLWDMKPFPSGCGLYFNQGVGESSPDAPRLGLRVMTCPGIVGPTGAIIQLGPHQLALAMIAELPTDARFGAPDRVLSPHRFRDQFREVRSRVFLWLGRLGHSPSN